MHFFFYLYLNLAISNIMTNIIISLTNLLKLIFIFKEVYIIFLLSKIEFQYLNNFLILTVNIHP